MFDLHNLNKRAILKCPREYRSEFKNSKCSVTISVGQPIHEGDKFNATLLEVNDNFKECTIMMCDSLQRHTLKIGSDLDMKQLHKKSNQAGDEWLERNMKTIKQLDIKYDIIRWDEWLSSNTYKNIRKQIDDLYLSDVGFYSAVEKTALSFLERYLNKKVVFEQREDVLCHSREYLKEEAAVMLIWAQSNYQFEVYPSPRNLALRYVYQNFIAKTKPELVRETSLKFKTITIKKESLVNSIGDFTEFSHLISSLPGYVYILDTNNIYRECNLLQARAFGLYNTDAVIGKRNKDMPIFSRHSDLAEILDNNNLKIMRSVNHEPVELEEEIPYVNSEIAVFKSYKIPLFNKDLQVVGLLGVSFDITESKKRLQNLQEKCAEKELALDNLLANLPGHVYWMDEKNRFLGCNDQQAHDFALQSRHEIIGLSAKFSQTPENAATIIKNNNKVMAKGEVITEEEKFKEISGKELIYFSRKVPLKNKHGNIVGLLGISLDITAQKEAEQLKINNEKLEIEKKSRQLITEEQEKFKKIVGQMLHDIQSPLTTLDTLLDEASSILPEISRIGFRHATDRIGDITKNLLNQYQNKVDAKDKDAAMLVSLALLQIISEKRYEYNKFEDMIKFEHDIKKNANFAFIKINPSDFKRMISNLINNAFEAVLAIDGKRNGIVSVKLSASPETITIVIYDNGCGMPLHIQEKFNSGIKVTEGKENGHGDGLIQVRNTLDSYGGSCMINASASEGTRIQLKYPVTLAPHWITPEVKIIKDGIVIILDDDSSIHDAWDSRFKSYLEEFPTIKIKHFTHGRDAINYIKELTSAEKEDTVLLTDYELLKQDLNGLDVVSQTKINRTILVTSHAANNKIQDLVIKAGIKMLPKELTPLVDITVDRKIQKGSRIVDLVWVEDQKLFVDSTIRAYYTDVKVDVYYDPDSFMEVVAQYPLDTRIVLDTYYYTQDNESSYDLTGFALAKILHNMGYTNLILYSGEVIPEDRIPAYLRVILKSDFEANKQLHKI